MNFALFHLFNCSQIDFTDHARVVASAIGAAVGKRFLKCQFTLLRPVRRQGFGNQELLKQVKSLARLVDVIMRRAGGDASAALRASFV